MGIVAAQLQAVVTVQGGDKAKSDLFSIGNVVNSTGGILKNALGGALSFASNVAGQALGFLKDQLVDSVHAAMDHQQVMAQTAQAIKSTKDASGETATSIDNLADSLSHVTEFSHDTIQSGENLLLTFTGIGKKAFPEATQAMLDLSQATGQDMKSSAIQLGKALNDPLTGLTALQRVGVTFSDEEKKAIKTAMAHNDVLGAQKVMLKELETEFGGSATAVGKTFAGQVAILKNNFEDLQEKIGTAILPILGQLMSTISSSVLPLIEQFANYLQSPAFQSFASMVGHDLLAVFQQIASFIKANAIPAFQDFMIMLHSPEVADLIDKLKQLGSTLISIVAPAFSSSNISINTVFDFIITTAIPALSGLVSALTGAIQFLNNAHVAIGIVGGILLALFIPAIIKSGVESVLASIKIGVNYVKSIIMTGVEGWQAAGKLGTFILTMIRSGAEAVANAAKITASFVGSMIKAGAEAVTNAAKVTASFVASMVKAGIEAAVNAAKITASFIASMVATGAQAVVTGAQIVASFVAGLVSAAAEAVVSAGIMMATLVPALAAVAVEVIAATWPFILIGAVVAAVVVGIILAVQHWGEISKWLQGVWDAFSAWFQSTLQSIGNFFHSVWESIISFFQSAWNTLVSIAKAAAMAVLAAIIGPFGLLIIYIIQHWQQILSETQSVWTNITSAVSNAVNGIISFIGNAFNSLVSGAVSWGSDMIGNFVNGITNAAGGLISAAQNIASQVASILHFSKPDVGPLADSDKWMPDMMELLASGINSNLGKVKSAALNVSATIANPASQSSFAGPSTGGGLQGLSVVPSSVSQGTGPIQIVVQPAPVMLDGRTLTNGLMPYVTSAIRMATGTKTF